ncbi:Uncharacterized protein BM_BM3170 [Brugia malayi]|uniref:Bm3170 n=1 Tax=Brugia malayi TaxID=6279 RepID=A0A0K0J941_BRUMA|nr:Uncharacterized protein BM_BM3170 [Brugia malayi]CRZ24924.1 Bm3170 [Brugia malayi]VIO93837.1 Uncharacterized protein BM_BM3170 [Brugia malayi]
MQNNCSSVLQQEIQEISINSLLAKLNSIEEQALDDIKLSAREIAYSSQTESLAVARNSAIGGDDDLLYTSVVNSGAKKKKLERKIICM